MLKSGYSYETVRENIAQLRRDGMVEVTAIAIAYALGRVSFFRVHSRGALPEWLAHPKGYRLREHYDKRGNSIVNQHDLGGADAYREQMDNSYQRNPSSPNPRKLAQAAQLFHEFTGRKSARITKHELPASPTEGLVFGRLVDVGYESARDGRLYRHTFRVRSRPLLVATPDGKTVYIVGGRYAFTDRGIVDK
jgi:hypothetical protein